MKLTPINETGYKRIWCPICEQDRPKPKFISLWLSPPPNFVLVCYYCICDACVKSVKDMSESMRTKSADQIEERLLKRYPKLIDKLPIGYQSDMTNFSE